ncbi:MAG: FAD-binding protein [Proteobacteria bacterium]|nr:MAG: FAD-binding protein [Pseudomonadota bacterium]
MSRLQSVVDKLIETDVLIIGSEGAGATAALEAIKYGVKVTVVTKGTNIGKSGATVTGDADLDVDSNSLFYRFGLKDADPADSKDKFFEDMIKGGKFLNNQKLAEIHVDEAPDRLQDLLNWGVKIDSLTQASGHSYPRGTIIPGTKLMPRLRKAVLATDVQLIPNCVVTDLLTSGKHVIGAVGINAATGEFIAFKAGAVIVCTGGAMRMYPYTTAPEELTGDGGAMAYRVGAEMVEMEFPMFLPGSFPWPPALKGVDVPFILSTAGSVGGHLLNKKGDRFLRHWDPERMEWTTRDIASVAIMAEILAGRGSEHGGVYVSLKHLPDNLIDNLETWLPPEYYPYYGGFNMKDYLPDLKKDAIESVPASHFFNGGIRIDGECATSLPGLFASGEATGGVHGANRLSGNAFTEMIVFGHRSGRFAANYAKQVGEMSIDVEEVEKRRQELFAPLERESGLLQVDIRKHMQQLVWEKAGVIRDGNSLQEALKEIIRIRQEDLPQIHTINKDRIYNREWIQSYELGSMLTIMEMVCRTSLKREESRGSLYRRDYPQTDNINWAKNQVVKKSDEEMQIHSEPLVVTKLEPPKKIMKYGRTD